MELITLIILFAFAPSLALLWYFYHKDKYEPEPKRYVAVTFIYAAIFSTALADIFEEILNSILMSILMHSAITLALIASIVEEPAKALAIRVPYKDKQMDGIMDGVVYGVAAGLGFASVENLLYGLGFGVEITIIRAFLTPIAHASWSAIVGVGYGLKSEGKISSLTIFLLAAIVLHFLWDYSVFMTSINLLYSIPVFTILLVNIVMIRYFLRAGLQEDKLKFGR